MKMSLINLDTEDQVMVDMRDILFIVSDHTTIILHTFKGRFRPPSTLKDFVNILGSDGFDWVDKSCVAKLDKITRFDKLTRIAYFDKRGERTKSCNVSRRNIKKVEHLPHN